MLYTIDVHNHRLAAWSASTAARASRLCRFSVQQGVRILEGSGFDRDLASPDLLPQPDALDFVHRGWRTRVIDAAAQEGVPPFTHGVAAKLINSYLKVRFVCGGHHEHERVRRLHPPIDALLLMELARNDVGGLRRDWRRFAHARWSKFDSDTYEGVIKLIKETLNGEPMWTIEQYWGGYQGR